MIWGGGLVSTSLNSGKRFYDSPIKLEEKGVAKFMKTLPCYIGMHVHPLIVGLLYDNMNWQYALSWYFIFILSVIILYKTPLYLKRPVSRFITMISILINIFIIPPVKGFEWFIPILFIKIICGHLVTEEPYDK